MGTGVVTYGTDPKAKTITVYYTESSTIYEGMPVCYEFDATTNWLGVSSIDATSTASSITESSTTAESYGNEGKFIRVEDPDADNIHAFAGVVAGAGLAGKTGPCAIDIYIPNGAIVPVRTDQSCTVGRTVLSVHTAEQHLTGPYETAGRPVAIAWETNTALASTTGTVLAKLDTNLFLSQKADAVDLLVDDQDTGNTFALNQIKVDFASATGNCMALSVVGTLSGGAASNGYGAAIYGECDLEATASAAVAGSGFWINVLATQAQPVCALQAGVYEDGTAATLTNVHSVLQLTTQYATNPEANRHCWIYLEDNGTYPPDVWFYSKSLTDAAMTTASSVTTSHKIPIVSIAGTVYYVAVGTATS